MKINSNVTALRVKCAGGAAAQTLALIDAIYVSQQTKRRFVFEYYPSGTGTYWPFEIEALLKPHERPLSISLSRGHFEGSVERVPGNVDLSHPINSKNFSVENIYFLVRKLKLDRFLLGLRGEIPIYTSMEQLDKVKMNTKSISGGFLPVQDKSVLKELNERFIQSGLPSPVAASLNQHSTYDVVIHYRLGDKRAKFTNPEVVGDDGVINPDIFASQIKDLGFLNPRVLVLSDEPVLAQELLNEVGIAAEVSPNKNDIWTDLHLMAHAKIFIGSWSQVSHLASVCVLHNGGRAFLPSEKSGRNSLSWTLEGLVKFEPKFLPESHRIYFK